MKSNGRQGRSGGGSAGRPGGEQWKRLQERRMESVWNRVARSAQGLGDEMLFQAGREEDDKRHDKNARGGGSSWTALFDEVLYLWDDACGSLFDLVQRTVQACLPGQVAPLILVPATCWRRFIHRSISSIRRVIA